MKTISAFLVAWALLAGHGALAQETDVEGSKDHPMIPRMAGFVILGYDFKEFDAVEFMVGEDKFQTVEGKRWQIQYLLKEGAKQYSAVQVTRNYKNAFAQKGGKILFDTPNDLTVSLSQGGGTLYAHIRTGAGDEIVMRIVEKSAMEQQVALSAGELAKALKEKGSIALHNILFDTGKATIKPESAKQLATVAEVLKAEPPLKVEIQGHTDNVGSAASNLALSQSRAEAVRAYLAKTHGIAAARMIPKGYGATKPMADNGTDAGRAQNRRVELVKRP